MKDEIMRGVVAMKTPVILTIALSILFYIIVTFFIRFIDVKSDRSNIANLFVGLEGKALFHLSFAWLKFALFTVLLLVAKTVEIYSYMLILCFCLGTILLDLKLRDILIEVISTVLCLGGLWVGTTLLDYLSQVKDDFSISASYWMLAIVFILCALAIFIREIGIISSERRTFDENGETE